MSFDSIVSKSATKALTAAILIGLSGASAQAQAPRCIRTRAAFDIGSEQTKMKVFKIDICKSRIVEQVYPAPGNDDEDKASRANIPFKKDLNELAQTAKDAGNYDEDMYPRFSDMLMVKAEKEFKRLKESADRFQPEDFIGVATEAFRQSKNAEYLISNLETKLHIDMLIPSQAQEALIEWISATANLKVDMPLKNVVTWGIGGGSMQMGAKMLNGGFGVFRSQLASVGMYQRAVEELRGAGPLLPLSAEDIQKLITIGRMEGSRAPIEIKDRAVDPGVEVFGVGGVINKSVKGFLKSMGIDGKVFTTDDLNDALVALQGKEEGDPIFGNTPKEFQAQTPTNIALVLGVMRAMHLTKIYYSPIDNTYGAPFTKEFGIKMPVQKPEPVVHKAPKPSNNGGQSNNQTAQKPSVQERSAPIKVEEVSMKPPVTIAKNGSASNANKAMCDSAIAAEKTPGVCKITNPSCNPICDAADTSHDGKICTIKGNPTVIYNICQ